MEDGDEMALSAEDLPLTLWGIIKREMIGWDTGETRLRTYFQG